MDLVAGAMGILAPKLLDLLQDEYKLQTGVKAEVESLAKNLKAMHLALSKVAQVPHDQLDSQVKLWASEAREESYDMEDFLDTFIDDGGNKTAEVDKGIFNRLLEKMSSLFNLSRFKASHDIASAIEDIKKRVDEMAKRRDSWKVDDVVANSATTTNVDPRILMTLRIKASELVGMDEPRDALINMLTIENAALLPRQSKKRKMNISVDDASDKETRIVSVVGSGGLGKTTLAKVVYEEMLTVDKQISCKAFVPVGQNPNLKKVLRDILIDLDKSQYMDKINFLMILDERQLIEEVRAFLKQKRYFIVIDDVWDVPSWNTISTALLDNNNTKSKILITTRCSDVADLVHYTYKIQPLHPDNSKILFYGRIFGSQDSCPESFSGISEKILKKCDGVPLAIITIASLLANKPEDITEWQEVCNSIGSGLGSNNDMRKILSLSYYDLPSHMKTCFLYLSMYPEDYEINIDELIWKWICEGFIQPQKKGDDIFELGRSYFNDLINRSLVQPIEYEDEIYACRVHDMILDLICSLAIEENFVTTSDDIENVMSSKSKKLRRLSLKSSATWPKKGVAQLRSIVVFGASFDSETYFSCFHMLRVLDLDGYSLQDCGGSKLCIGNLIHLRYLSLTRTDLEVLPEGIEKLQFLQVLKSNGFIKLPESIFDLRRLMCLTGVRLRSRNLLSNLGSLQVLSCLHVDKDSAGALEALTQLTTLGIDVETVDQSIGDTLMNSLSNLPRLQSLELFLSKNLISWERWAPPRHLRVVSRIFSPALPRWISPASLPHLTHLHMKVVTVRPEDIQILGTMPNLAMLSLCADRGYYLEEPLQNFLVSGDAFPLLRTCVLGNVLVVPSMFIRGAMPRVEYFDICLRAKDFFSNPGGFDFDDLAMDHLPSLQSVQCSIINGEIVEEEVEKLREALKHTADVHPNHPRLYPRDSSGEGEYTR